MEWGIGRLQREPSDGKYKFSRRSSTLNLSNKNLRLQHQVNPAHSFTGSTYLSVNNRSYRPKKYRRISTSTTTTTKTDELVENTTKAASSSLIEMTMSNENAKNTKRSSSINTTPKTATTLPGKSLLHIFETATQ